MNEKENQYSDIIHKAQVATKEVLNDISLAKTLVINNRQEIPYNMDIYNSLAKLESPLYRYERFIDANMYNEAIREIENLETLIEDTVANFGIYLPKTIPTIKAQNTKKYVWKTEPNACEKCSSLDGNEYYNKNDIPSKLHPNCKCGIDEVDIDNNSESSEVVIIDADDDIDEKKEKVRNVLVEIIKKIQNIIKFISIFQKNTEKFQTPAEYLKISGIDVRLNKPNTTYDYNFYTSLKYLRDINLKLFIAKKYNVAENVPVVMPKRNSKLYEAIINSPEMSEFICENYKDISEGKLKDKIIDFKFSKFEAANTIGKCVIYKPHINQEGNMIFQIVDYYDFSYLKKYGKDFVNIFITTLNNNAYIWQFFHLIKNYVIIVPIEIKYYEFWKYIE